MPVHPIQFAIPDRHCVEAVPPKTRGFATCVPGRPSTYVFSTQEEYYQDMRDSYFAITTCKGGWDCMRHYEILANGCVPYFPDLPDCPADTMTELPKALILEAMALPGVSHGAVDMEAFDPAAYHRLATAILEWTRERLTCSALARRFLGSLRFDPDTDPRPVLFVSTAVPDYQSDLLLIGLKKLLGGRCVDVPEVSYVYEDYRPNPEALYGRGFSYTRVVPAEHRRSPDAAPEGVETALQKREFGLVVYGSAHRALHFADVVQAAYPVQDVAFVCGEDIHRECVVCALEHPDRPCFVRELGSMPGAASFGAQKNAPAT